jgi:hypothetical protein
MRFGLCGFRRRAGMVQIAQTVSADTADIHLCDKHLAEVSHQTGVASSANRRSIRRRWLIQRVGLRHRHCQLCNDLKPFSNLGRTWVRQDRDVKSCGRRYVPGSRADISYCSLLPRGRSSAQFLLYLFLTKFLRRSWSLLSLLRWPGWQAWRTVKANS